MNPRLLILDDDDSIRWVLNRAFSKDYDVVLCDSVAAARRQLKQQTPAVMLSDIRLPDDDGIRFLRQLKQTQPNLPVILMTAHADLQTAVQSFDAGAFEFVAKPFDLDELQALVQKALAVNDTPTVENDNVAVDRHIIGRSAAMQPVFRAIGRLAKTSFNVLLIGESGTGKERVARALHEHSPRAQQAFIALNMAAIPHDLIEAELFGYEKGAFTGAANRAPGKFEQADGGTLFLDEIGDMPLSAQTRLLRVLSDGGFYRVGGSQLLKTNARVIAATHQNLGDLVKQGKFREDLFHRLHVVRIDLPSLRERNDDVPILIDYFLEQAASEAGVARKHIDQSLWPVLQQYPWPGNVRQLENLCRYLTVMAVGEVITADDLPPDIKPESVQRQDAWQKPLRDQIRQFAQARDAAALQTIARELESLLVLNVLDVTQGHRQETARLLGWGRNTLTRYLQAIGVDGDGDPH